MKLDMIKPVLCVVLAFFLTATVVLSLQLLSAWVDNARVTTSIRDDLRSGAVAFPPFWLGPQNRHRHVDRLPCSLNCDFWSKRHYISAPKSRPCVFARPNRTRASRLP